VSVKKAADSIPVAVAKAAAVRSDPSTM
jgi:hypothetical protein